MENQFAVRPLVTLAAATVAIAFSAAPALGADMIYWGNYNATPGTISHANLNNTGVGGNQAMTGATVNNPYGIAIDAAAGKVYWANFSSPPSVNGGNGAISVANLNGTGAHDLTITGTTVSGPAGIAIDPIAGRIYWANQNNNTISSANLDGSGGALLTTTGASVSSPDGVAIDPAANKIYWANATGSFPVAFANLNGTGGGGKLNVTGAPAALGPIGVAIDPVGGKIYWARQGGGIDFANLNNTGGGGALNITGATNSGPQALAIDQPGGRVYWANASGAISFANLNNTGGGHDLNTTGATTNLPTFPVLLRAPSAAGAPALNGRFTTGSTLSCSSGTWGADFLGSFLYRAPQSFAYSWTRNGAPVAGATSSTLKAGSTGSYACRVTASNFAGSATEMSTPRTVVPKISSLKAKINSKKHTAKFSFKATGSTDVQCALIKIKKHGKKQKPHFKRCKSPKTYKHLKKGRYKFEVRAVSVFGTGPAKSKTFKIG